MFILTCLNFSHIQSTLHLMQYTYRDIFSNSFWTHLFWYLVVLLKFLFHLFHIGKMFFSGDFFDPGKQKKSLSRWDRVNREGGAQGSCRFWSKSAEHSVRCGQFAPKSPIMKWANTLKESSKKFTEAEHSLSQQRLLVLWNRWVPRTLV